MNDEEYEAELIHLSKLFGAQVAENEKLNLSRKECAKALDTMTAAMAGQIRENQRLESENEKLKQALRNISNYLSEFWLSDPDEDWDNLANHLYRAGFNCVRDWGGEPEPFIHGDNAEGAEG